MKSQNEKEKRKKKMEHGVVILGAGLAGLSCALQLHDGGMTNVRVLEARNRVGGRTFSVTTEDGVHHDMGGAYIGTTQDRVMQLLERFNLNLYDVYESV